MKTWVGVHPPPHQPSPDGSASATPAQGGSDWPGSAGVPPASLFLMGVAEHQRDFAGSHHMGVAEHQRDFAGSHHVGGNRNGRVEGEPRRRWVDSSTGEGRGCARPCAGGTPALPGSLRPHDKPGTWFTPCRGIRQDALCKPRRLPLQGGVILRLANGSLPEPLARCQLCFRFMV